MIDDKYIFYLFTLYSVYIP